MKNTHSETKLMCEMTKHNLTVEDLAEALGIVPGVVYYWSRKGYYPQQAKDYFAKINVQKKLLQ